MADVDQFICEELRFAEDETRESAGRLIATLLTEGIRAKDRPEIFQPGALRWDEKAGIPIDVQHVRSSLAARAYPVRDSAGTLSIDAPLIDGVWGREARALVKGGVATGMSIQFAAVTASRRNGMRVITDAILTRASVVDSGSYATDIEVRHASESGLVLPSELTLWL